MAKPKATHASGTCIVNLDCMTPQRNLPHPKAQWVLYAGWLVTIFSLVG